MNDATFAERWPLAQAFGWYLQVIDRFDPEYVFVRAPSSFPCEHDQWAAVYIPIRWRNQQLRVPDYFWNDAVLQMGTRQPVADHDRFPLEVYERKIRKPISPALMAKLEARYGRPRPVVFSPHPGHE